MSRYGWQMAARGAETDSFPVKPHNGYSDSA